jgi:hypothetical protein
LSRHSAHHPSVHDSWPVALYKHRVKLCTDESFFSTLHNDLISKAESYDISCNALRSIASSGIRHNIHGTHRSKESESTGQVLVLWLILPFFPVFQHVGIASSLRRLYSSHVIQRSLALAFGGRVVNIRIGWRNALPPLSRIIASSSPTVV